MGAVRSNATHELTYKHHGSNSTYKERSQNNLEKKGGPWP